MNSRIFYRGPSQLDGAPILGIMSGLETPSHNTKTGDMLQTYIVREDVSPPDAVLQGLDSSVCGGCALRGDGTGLGRTCYVQLKWAPLGVWKYVQREKDLDIVFTRADVTGRFLRLGTYGDPAAIPLETWYKFLPHVAGWTGYTHQWRDDRFREYKDVCMASVDSIYEMADAQARGWRTFRVRASVVSIKASTEIVCPASHEGGRVITCADCQLCNGVRRTHSHDDLRKHIVIVAHGQRASKFGTSTLPFGDQ